MGRNINDIISTYSKERQEVIEQEADRIKKEYEQSQGSKNNPHLPDGE